MFLNHEQIKEQNIIEGFSEKEFAEGSYNLTADHIIDMNSKENDSFTLKPQGMVYVVFKEKLSVPANIIGFAHVKTSLTKRGIMATNIGVIDPNYKGYISTLLINFGKSDHFISKGDVALRVTFAPITASSCQMTLKSNDLTSSEYIRDTKRNIADLDEKFLNLNAIQKEVTQSVYVRLLTFGAIFTFASFAVADYFQIKNSQEKDLDRAVKKYETELSIANAHNNLLQEKLNTYDYKLSAMQDTLNAQAVKIRALKTR